MIAATHRPLFTRSAASLALLLPGLAGAAPASHECLIEPYQRLEIRSPVTGLIKSVTVERGSLVQKGQVLLELDYGIEAALLAAARYRSQMQGEVRAAEARSRYADLKQERLKVLNKDNLVSAQDRDEAIASAQVAESDLLAARDNRELAVLEVKRLTETLEQRKLRSPINGIVTDRLQHNGELAQSGETGKPILRLAQTHPLRVELVLPVARLGSIKLGEVATIVPEPPLAGRWSAAVKQIDRVVDAASGTFRVLLELPNPDGAIAAGVRCSAAFR